MTVPVFLLYFTNDPDEWNTKSCLIYITFNLLQLNRVMNGCIYIAGPTGVTGEEKTLIKEALEVEVLENPEPNS